MGTRCIASECLGTTGFSYTLCHINGKPLCPILDGMCEWGDQNRV